MWQFEFALPQPEGSIVSTDETATADGAIVTISELRVSPTMITAAMALRVDNETVTSWGTANDTLVSIEGPGGTSTANTSYHLTQDSADQGPDGDENLFMTVEEIRRGHRYLDDHDPTALVCEPTTVDRRRQRS